MILGISLGFKGKLHQDIYKSWKILDKNFQVNYIKKRTTHPHITLVAGSTYNYREICKIIKNLKIKKFKLKSPGLAVFTNKDPNLHIRWERNSDLIKCFDLIRDKTKKFYYKQRKYYDLASWVPRSCIAYKDFKYSQIPAMKKEMNFLFKNHTVLINRIYLIEVTDREILKYTIKI